MHAHEGVGEGTDEDRRGTDSEVRVGDGEDGDDGAEDSLGGCH